MATEIHPSAIVSPRAEIGDGVTIGPYSVVEDDVVLEEGCWVAPHAVIRPFVRLGRSCRVHSGAVLGDLPQDKSYRDCRSYVEIGDGTVIREGVTVHRGTKEETITRVGKRCFLMAFSHVAHNASLGNDVVLANGALVAGYATIGDGAFISGHCLIHQFVRVGRLAMLGGGAGVSRDVPPFCMVPPLHLNTIAGLNIVGLRRAGLDSTVRTGIRRAYRDIFQGTRPLREAARSVIEASDIPEARELAQFVLESQRGVCRPRRLKEDG